LKLSSARFQFAATAGLFLTVPYGPAADPPLPFRRHCERSAAIVNGAAAATTEHDCCVALLLAMTP
jgi:hypothetical protein